MRKLIVFSLSAVMLFCGAISAQERGFGLGVILGEPTGLSAKLWTGADRAFDGAISWSSNRNNVLHLHIDYLFHNFTLLKVEKGQLPFYYGVGGRVRLQTDPAVGVRIPFGLEYIFATAPVGLFFEVVPVIELVPNSDFDIDAGLGGRYYF